MPRLLGPLVVALALSTSALASAAPSPAATRAFEEGRALLSEGKTAEASARFLESVRIDPTIGGLLNLAECHVLLGQRALAYRRFREAEALASQGDKLDRGALAKQRAESLRGSIEIVHLVLPAGTTEVMVKVDDAEPSAVDARRSEVPLEPGSHHLTVTVPHSERRFETTTRAVAGGSHPVTVTWEEEAKTLPQPSVEPQERAWAIPAYATAGAGAAAVVVGGVFGMLTLGKKSDLESACPAYPTCPASKRNEAIALDDDARGTATVSTVALVSGVALIGVGAALFFLSPTRARTTVRRPFALSVTF